MNSNWIFTKVSDRRTAILAINNEDMISVTKIIILLKTSKLKTHTI